jgi:hypothetical protein
MIVESAFERLKVGLGSRTMVLDEKEKSELVNDQESKRRRHQAHEVIR